LAKINVTAVLDIEESEIPTLVGKIRNGLVDYVGARVYITENKEHLSIVIEEH